VTKILVAKQLAIDFKIIGENLSLQNS